MTTNPWESRARTVKAIAISDHILAGLAPEDLNSPHLMEWIAHTSDELRRDLATAAGVNAPSDMTWAEVTARVAVAVERERTARSQPYAGQGKKAVGSSAPASVAT